MFILRTSLHDPIVAERAGGFHDDIAAVWAYVAALAGGSVAGHLKTAAQ
jgi:hypothetical protein